MSNRKFHIKASLRMHREALAQGRYSSQEFTRACLERITAEDVGKSIFLAVDAQRAMAMAAESDRRRQEGRLLSSIDGIPFAVQDNFCTQAMPTTCASRFLDGYRSPYDATVVSLLQKAGGVLIGKLNMNPFAMGADTTAAASCAVAVSRGMVCFSVGADASGSLLGSASRHGVFALQATHGAISQYGVINASPSFHSIGVIAGFARDCKEVLELLAEKDAKDAMSQMYPKAAELSAPACNDTFFPNLRVALPNQLPQGLTPYDREAIAEAEQRLCRLGAHVDRVAMPSIDQMLTVSQILSAAEASSQLSRFDGVRFGARSKDANTLNALYGHSRAEGFPEGVKMRILFGAHMLSANNRERFYLRAQAAREQFCRQFKQILENYDVILIPTVEISSKECKNGFAWRMPLSGLYSNLTGLPAITVPQLENKDRQWNASVQLVGAPFKEALLVRLAGEGRRADELTGL